VDRGEILAKGLGKGQEDRGNPSGHRDYFNHFYALQL
jgi:hypothetical protein